MLAKLIAVTFFLLRLVLWLGAIDLVLFLLLGAVVLYQRIRCKLSGGHDYERHVLVEGVCFEMICTKCGDHWAAPYDLDPDY